MMKFDRLYVGDDQNDNPTRINVAIVNTALDKSAIEASYLGKPIINRDRLKKLSNILNDISSYRMKSKIHRKIDLAIFPEVSIPHSWTTLLGAWARKHNIGLICGLEHRVDHDSQAWNEIFTALPFQCASGHISCYAFKRLKRHYSPEEEFILNNLHLKIPSNQNHNQILIRWRGVSFAIFNCFELTAMEERAQFKSEVDFIVATEFNKDVNYFSNIIESTARDIHCYIIQANDSMYGDSRIVYPSKTEKMNPVRIKGGENDAFVVSTLDVRLLREFQYKKYGLQKEDDSFKPTPPGFSLDALKSRMK